MKYPIIKERCNGTVPFYYMFPDDWKLALNEVFIDIPMNYNGMQIADRYQVSNYGRVFDKYHCRFPNIKMQGNILIARIIDAKGNPTAISIARAELIAFRPIPDYQWRKIIYVDNNSTNLSLDNLYWKPACLGHSTREGIRAYNLRRAGRMTEDEWHKLLIKYAKLEEQERQKSFTLDDLKKMQNLTKDERLCKVDITLPYQKRHSKKALSHKLTYKQIAMICQYYQDYPLDRRANKIDKMKYFVKMLRRFNFFGKAYQNGLVELCEKIFRREIYKNVSCNYTF